MSIEHGGPAFPQPDMVDDGQLISQGETGMTLRDYFAAKAMSAMIASPDDAFAEDCGSECAAKAYAYANRMLEARKV